MLRAIGELPEDVREVFDLVRILGMTQTEAAHGLGVPAETVKRRCCCRRSAAAGSRCAPSRRTSMLRLPHGS
jgi:DNA-directed RNA polymerase specialized sigma24 family protein